MKLYQASRRILNTMEMYCRVKWHEIVHIKLFTVRMVINSRLLVFYSHIVPLIHNQWWSWKPVIDKNHIPLEAIRGSRGPGQVECVMDLGSPGKRCHTEAETGKGHGCENSNRLNSWTVRRDRGVGLDQNFQNQMRLPGVYRHALPTRNIESICYPSIPDTESGWSMS